MTKTCPCILNYEKDIRVGFSLFLMGFDEMPEYQSLGLSLFWVRIFFLMAQLAKCAHECNFFV